MYIILCGEFSLISLFQNDREIEFWFSILNYFPNLNFVNLTYRMKPEIVARSFLMFVIPFVSFSIEFSTYKW